MAPGSGLCATGCLGSHLSRSFEPCLKGNNGSNKPNLSIHNNLDIYSLINSYVLNNKKFSELSNWIKTHIRSFNSLIKPFAVMEANYGRYIFSTFLDLLAGYGYKPIRSVRTYLLTIVVFASFYYVLSQGTDYQVTQLGALVLSLTSFHGRGFFPGLNTYPNSGISLDNPLLVLAAVEAVIGLIIEISFIATFTQRYFGK